MMLHRVRLMLKRQRTQLSNAMRAHIGVRRRRTGRAHGAGTTAGCRRGSR
jgi:hypothetical protein